MTGHLVELSPVIMGSNQLSESSESIKKTDWLKTSKGQIEEGTMRAGRRVEGRDSSEREMPSHARVNDYVN